MLPSFYHKTYRHPPCSKCPTIVSLQRILSRIQAELDHIAQPSRYLVALSIRSSPDHDVPKSWATRNNPRFNALALICLRKPLDPGDDLRPCLIVHPADVRPGDFLDQRRKDDVVKTNMTWRKPPSCLPVCSTGPTRATVCM